MEKRVPPHNYGSVGLAVGTLKQTLKAEEEMKSRFLLPG